MTEQRTSAAQRERLRRRYSSDEIPDCPVCGARLVTDYPRPFVDVASQQIYLRTYCLNAESWTGKESDTDHARLSTFHLAIGDASVVDALDDADALAGSLAEAARLQVLVDACIDVLGRAVVRSDGYSLHRAGFRVWEILTGVSEAPAMKGTKDD